MLGNLKVYTEQVKKRRRKKTVKNSIDEIRFKNPKNLKVLDKCMELNGMIYQLVKQFPTDEKYIIVSQIKRSCLSVGANITEGNSQIYKSKELSFYSISLGSLNETIYWLDVSLQNNYLSMQEYVRINKLIEEIIKMLITMMNKLQNESA